MEFRQVERDPGAFQQSITADQLLAMCRRAFGDQAQPVSVTEFELGSYNSTYRVDLGKVGIVILRVAPAAERQSQAERRLMRNEHAAQPYLDTRGGARRSGDRSRTPPLRASSRMCSMRSQSPGCCTATSG